MDQKILLKIVQTWRIKNKPELRGFKCGNCGRILHKAWHNYLNIGRFKTPVHLCNECQAGFNINSSKSKVDKSKIKVGLADKTMKAIIKSWKTSTKSIRRIFVCDMCGKNIYKAYHIWVKSNNVLSEIHFCRKCGDSLR